MTIERVYMYVHVDVDVYVYKRIPVYVHVSSLMYLRKRRVDYRVPYLGVRRSLSLASEIGTEYRTRSIHMMYHTSFLLKAWIRLNAICQNFEDHIKDSQ